MARARLSIVAIVRNEEHIIREWVEHHISVGVDRFYITDNASTDNTASILLEYSQVVLYHDPSVKNVTQLDGEGLQRHAYARMLKDCDTDYALICDADEFFYTTGSRSIKDHLDIMDSLNVSQLIVQLKNFTSGGVIKQPDRVIPNFTKRCVHTSEYKSIHKCIVRPEAVRRPFITHCFLYKGHITSDCTYGLLDPAFSTEDCLYVNKPPMFPYRRVYEDVLLTHDIFGNHYVNQSREWFFSVKAKRGVAAIPNIRSTESFDDYWQRRWDNFESKTVVDDFDISKGYL